MKKIAVLLGGTSTEREISLRSGMAVRDALSRKGYQCEGFDTGVPGWETGMQAYRPDVVFVALHGQGGEDGTIQGYLETLGYPYTGSGVLSSALAMNKIHTQRILRSCGLPVPPFHTVHRLHTPPDRERFAQGVREIGYPVVVKAPSQGSTLGIYFVDRPEDLPEALESAFGYEDEILVEKQIRGMEITVSVMGNLYPFPLPTLEITTTTGTYDYQTKYTPGMSTHIIPARLPEDVRVRCRILAREAYRILGMRGFGRIDIMLDGQNNPYVIEANTIPGMTATSLIPDAAEHLGLSFGDLCELICQMAGGAEFPVDRMDRQDVWKEPW